MYAGELLLLILSVLLKPQAEMMSGILFPSNSRLQIFFHVQT